MLGATLVAPGHNHVVPLEPEFIAPQDGAVKQDCENRAAHRWLAAHGHKYAHLKPIYLGDDLFSHQPLCEAVLATGGHFLFVCKPATHTLIQEYITGVALESHTERVKHGRTWVTHRFRWISGVPLRDSKDALAVNWLEVEITDATGKLTYRNSFITDLAVDRNNAAERAAGGRARWKIENGSFNVMKTQGYNLEHSFGHGKQNLAALLVTLNLLAFAFHTATRQNQSRFESAVLQPAGGDHRVPDISDMGRIAGDARVHKAATTTALISIPTIAYHRPLSRTKPIGNMT
jgi:hypothetical protein